MPSESILPRTVHSLLALSLLLAFSAALRGQILLSGNLNEASAGAGGEVSAFIWQAQKFTTGAEPIGLDSVQLMLSKATSEDLSSDILVMLYTGTESPATYQATLLDPVDPIGEEFAVHEFLPDGEVVLSELSSYWVVVASESTFSSFLWEWTNSEEGTGEGFSTIWRQSPDNGFEWYGDSQSPYLMQVNVIPEPSAFGLAAGFLVAAGAWLRRSRTAR